MTKSKPKRRRGRPPDAERIERVRRQARPDVALQFERMTVAVLAAVARRMREGEQVSIEQLGLVRICAEWHTDYLSVQASGGVPEPSTPVVAPAGPPIALAPEPTKP